MATMSLENHTMNYQKMPISRWFKANRRENKWILQPKINNKILWLTIDLHQSQDKMALPSKE